MRERLSLQFLAELGRSVFLRVEGGGYSPGFRFFLPLPWHGAL